MSTTAGTPVMLRRAGKLAASQPACQPTIQQEGRPAGRPADSQASKQLLSPGIVATGGHGCFDRLPSGCNVGDFGTMQAGQSLPDPHKSPPQPVSTAFAVLRDVGIEKPMGMLTAALVCLLQCECEGSMPDRHGSSGTEQRSTKFNNSTLRGNHLTPIRCLLRAARLAERYQASTSSALSRHPPRAI